MIFVDLQSVLEIVNLRHETSNGDHHTLLKHKINESRNDHGIAERKRVAETDADSMENTLKSGQRNQVVDGEQRSQWLFAENGILWIDDTTNQGEDGQISDAQHVSMREIEGEIEDQREDGK